MFSSYFDVAHQLALGIAVLLAVSSVICWWRGRTNWALVLLTTTGFVLQLFAATLDPFLNQWDECFHAVVAKHMITDPFTPILYQEGVLANSASWTLSHLWFHKPPFFLWQIAVSLSLFGPEPWAVRIPSALWMTALIPVIYRMGCLLANRRAAWIAALLTTFSYYLLELTAGAITTDHNDAIFIATVACSWWALLEHWNDGQLRWTILVGLFAACAILTKVYVGGLVFLPWSIRVLMQPNRKGWERLVLGLSIAIGLSAIWFGSSALRFPDELRAQFLFDTGHLSEVVEGHTGNYGYHFDVIQQLLSPFTWWLIIPAYFFLVWNEQRKDHRLMLVVLFVAVHAVFALADTKMVSFTMVLFPLYVVAIGAALVQLTDLLIVERYRSWVLLLTTVVLVWSFFNLETLQYRHTLASPPKAHQQWRQQQLEAMPVLDKLQHSIADAEHSVVYNVPAIHHIQLMFSSTIEATAQFPLAGEVEQLHEKGYTVYAVQDGMALDQFPHGVIVFTDDVLRFPDVGRP